MRKIPLCQPLIALQLSQATNYSICSVVSLLVVVTVIRVPDMLHGRLGNVAYCYRVYT